jgi:hypothetical protein
VLSWVEVAAQPSTDSSEAAAKKAVERLRKLMRFSIDQCGG